MHITELNSFKLSDAVKFHNRLNPKIWGRDEHLLPEVREKLMAIADNFREFLGVEDLAVRDITISGSNAAYNYTPYSDIDLHLVVEFPADNEIYQELFNAKKYQYNDEHTLSIGGVPVELYVQNAAESPVSQGEYSIPREEWIQVPRRKRAKIDDTCVRAKVEDLDARIHSAIRSGNAEAMSRLWDKIKAMRQSGLDEHGEFGCENIVFKILRNKGCIKELRTARTAAQDHELSLKEQNRPQTRKVWGFSEGHQGQPYSSEDGVAPSTCMFLNEDDTENMVQQFIQDTAERLGIERMPEIQLHDDDGWSEQNHSFGMYQPELHVLHVNLRNRHIMDILRTVAHELAHCRQHEIEKLDDDAGATGSPVENEANAVAGIIMRDFANAHPDLFGHESIAEASGYIPTRAQAKDPRFKMALTVDVQPGQTGREANKMRLATDAQGHPQVLRADGKVKLAESLAQEFELFEDQDLFEVKMTSKNLANLAKDIKGARVGLEFEMIVPNVANDDGGDLEPDYDQDERVRDIDDAVNFFDDGDYNDRNAIRSLRERMESDYFSWETEKIDERWHSDQGFEFFREYLDREDPFDAEDAEEEARNELQAQYGDELDVEEFEKMLVALVDEKRQNYTQEQWDEQGRNFERAQEEFADEQRDDVSESEWLDDRGIRYASDVENDYGNVSWPYWTSSGDSEGDIESVALDFMNAMGMDTVAISSSYHGSYKKWVGNGWVSIGSNKPDDCFTIEPDGSLEGDDSNDTGLEFVSPPIPLEDIGTVMKKVQDWAGIYGAYTGDRNKTSIHTNISIPGYDLDKLDYLKAALLLGDEYVLREFDRIGNTYAAPAIEKVRALVKQNPDKAKQLLDKMKSQLNAEASKLIHSGQTNKFTSINTKGNRVEFRSPGGDYLSIIADNPQKMIDTINRMVVTLDAAMDPNKYKEEYQKKLYKMLTGQQSGREATSGAKREMKKDDKDLLNIFSRYAAGELPRAALKSFVRQAQLERKGKKADAALASHNWAIRRRDSGSIVKTFQADDYEQAFDVLQQYKQQHNITDNSLTYSPYNPSEEKPAEQPAQQQGNWGIWIQNADRFANQPGSYARGETPPLYRFSSEAAADRWIEQQRAERPNMRSDIEVREIEPAAPIPGSTLDLQRQRAAQEPQGVDTSVDYELYNRTTGEVIDTFPARNDDEARVHLDNYRQWPGRNNPDNFGVRRGPSVSAATVNRNTLAPTGPGPWEVFRISDGSSVAELGNTNRMSAEVEARRVIDQRREAPELYGVRTRQGADAAQGGIVDVEPDVAQNFAPQTLTRPGQGQQVFTGEWKVLVNGEEVYRFGGVGNNQGDANRVAAHWLRNNGMGVSGEGFEVYPVMSEGLTEGNQLRLRDFTITISPHALEQCYNRDIDATQVDNILKNISQAKSSIMGQPDNAPLIIHDGQGTALGIRRLAGQQLKLATVYNVPKDFVKGKYPTFQVDTNQPLTEGRDQWGNFDPPGPEVPPTMPAGTVRVDVSDVYDWYKLGQHISNMKGLGKHDFGKGPPSSIISFGDEDLEHQYIQALKKTGLTTTDIDPVDPNQPADMPKQKTDPTYNVNEADASDYELHDRAKLDRVLAKCCRMVVKGQQRDPERFGQVAACVIDPDNRMIYGINLPGPDGTRRHAERVAIDKYRKNIGEIPEGSIVVTTCSPCNSPMAERSGESCKDLLNSVGIHKVYAGYEDPTQHDDSDADFRVYVTENDQLWGKCQLFAQTFLGTEELPEAFDQPYKTKSEKSEYGDIDMLAKLPDGTNLSIMFNNQQDDEGKEVVQVEFYRNNSQEVTGEGDAQKIFATVLASIQKYIKKYKPSRLSFSASKATDPTIYYEPDQPRPNPESRAKLYDRLVQRYARAWGYRAFRADTGDLVIYELSRLQPAVAENFADGRNPQDKGDSKRHGVPTKASVSTLRKVAKQGGRKGQLAHWMANMKAGRAKAKRNK